MTMLIGQVEAAASAQLAEHSGRNVIVRGSATVHGPTTMSWAGGIQAPGPACHVGVAGWDPARISPTDRPVTCRRPGCRDVVTVPAVTAQLALWGPAEDLDVTS